MKRTIVTTQPFTMIGGQDQKQGTALELEADEAERLITLQVAEFKFPDVADDPAANPSSPAKAPEEPEEP